MLRHVCITHSSESEMPIGEVHDSLVLLCIRVYNLDELSVIRSKDNEPRDEDSLLNSLCRIVIESSNGEL